MSNEKAEGYLPIHFAVSSKTDQPGVIEVLLAHDKNNVMLSTLDPNGEIALHYAARKGHFKAAELLIAKGSHVNAINKIGQTPLSGALAKGHTNIALLLIKNGARVEGTDPAVSLINESLTELSKEIDQSRIEECSKFKKFESLFESIKCHYFFVLNQIVGVDENEPLPINANVLKDYIAAPNDTKITDETEEPIQSNYREEFITKMQALLNDAKFLEGSKEYKYIQQLKEAVSSGGTKSAYNLVHPIIKSLSADIRSSTSGTFRDYMQPIKAQIVELMKKYNEHLEQEKLTISFTSSIKLSNG